MPKSYLQEYLESQLPKVVDKTGQAMQGMNPFNPPSASAMTTEEAVRQMEKQGWREVGTAPTSERTSPSANPNNSDYNAIALIQKYFPKSEWQTAYAVMMGESGGQNIPSQFNQRKTENSHGLFQINLQAHPQMAQKVYDPEENVKFAAQLQREQGWQPWGAYTSGGYKKYLAEANQVMGTPQQGGFESVVKDFTAAVTPKTAYASEGENVIPIKSTAQDYLPKSSGINTQPEYTVKKGDTLWDIAEKSLGSGQRWKELIGYSGDPTKMPIGTKITIPQQKPVKSSPTVLPQVNFPTPKSSVTSPPSPKAQQQVSKYFAPNTMGGFQIPQNAQSLPQPTQKFVPFKGKVPIPTQSYISKNSNPIAKYFQPNTMGGFKY